MSEDLDDSDYEPAKMVLGPPQTEHASIADPNVSCSQSSRPLISVIMPAYNVAGYISEALESVFAQTYDNFEIVIVNDGSPDTEELERVLAPYRERIVYIRQENKGLSGARNTAIRAATGEYIALLDPDDAWEPNYLQVQTEILVADPSIDVLYPNAEIFGESRLAGRKYMDEFPSNGEVTFENICLRRCNVLIFVAARREAVLRAGMFDESLRSCEDFDLWLRILKQGGRISYHRQVLARYRRRGDSLSADLERMCFFKKKILDKVERTMELTPTEKRALEYQRRESQAHLDLYEGKRQFFQGDFNTAMARLTAAHAHFKSRKLGLVLKVLPIAPSLLRYLYVLRDRFFYRADTKY